MSIQQTSFVLADSAKCSGCRACELACFAGHRAEKKGKTVGTVTTQVIPRLYLARGSSRCMPIQCHHCEDAPCLKSCLTNAISRTEEGVVTINARKCIGCRNCAIACPFGAIEVFSRAELDADEAAKVTPRLVFKCDLCIDDEKPQCVRACPNEAISLIDTESVLEEKRIAAINAFEVFHPVSDMQKAPAQVAQGGE
jgi:electron transport protein HydN